MSGLPIAQHVPSTSEEMGRSTDLALSRACRQVFYLFIHALLTYNTKAHGCRTATDLNLHLPMTAKPLNENHAREMLNRTRAWLNCLNVERSTASQYGKPSTINPRDYILNNSEDWWKSSPYNMKNFDIHLCAYNGELKIMAEFLTKIYSDPKHLTGLNKVCLVLLLPL